jgi:hypothetical protein
MTKRKFLMEYKTTTKKTETIRAWVFAENRDDALKQGHDAILDIESSNIDCSLPVISISILGDPDGYIEQPVYTLSGALERAGPWSVIKRLAWNESKNVAQAAGGYLAVTSDKNGYRPFNPTKEDIMAEDWIIVNEGENVL